MPATSASNRRKAALLGMPTGTAFNRLRKRIMFELAVAANRHVCFRCGCSIASAEEFSIEHKSSWQLSLTPVETFFDTGNIAFSHLTCNVGASTKERPLVHGTRTGWKRGCRCGPCVIVKRRGTAEYAARWRAAGRDKTRKNYKQTVANRDL